MYTESWMLRLEYGEFLHYAASGSLEQTLYFDPETNLGGVRIVDESEHFNLDTDEFEEFSDYMAKLVTS